jgi:hypothetical protein
MLTALAMCGLKAVFQFLNKSTHFSLLEQLGGGGGLLSRKGTLCTARVKVLNRATQICNFTIRVKTRIELRKGLEKLSDVLPTGRTGLDSRLGQDIF